MQGIIFDFDGLILDTELPDFLSWQEIYHEHGCDLPLSLWVDCIGAGSNSTAFDPYAHLESLAGRPIDRQNIRLRRRQRNAKLLASQPILPGVEQYIEDAKRRGLKLAVASSSTQDWVDGHLARLGLDRHFDCVKCGDDVRHTKPDPEVYHAALGALELEAGQVVALEDSPNGVLAAKRAGIYCVAVPNALTQDLPLDHADLRLASLADLPLEKLLECVSVIDSDRGDRRTTY